MPKARGRHAVHRLTAVEVRNAKAGRYSDGGCLWLFVEESGARRWVLRTIVCGKRADIGLGSASPLAVSLKQAREEAVQLRRRAGAGEDIRTSHRQLRAVPTFEAAAKEVHEQHAKSFRNEKHAAQWLASLDTHVFPTLGSKRVDAITSDDVLRVLLPVWTTKAETARRVKQRIKIVLDWAKARRFCSGDNPVDGITTVLPRVRQSAAHHAAMPFAEVPAFVQTLREVPAADAVRLAFEWLILSASRTTEVLQARWSEIDRQARVWTVPASRVKSNREHRVPLTDRHFEILDAAAAIDNGSGFVFPGRSEKSPLSGMVFLMLLRRLGRKDIVPHGFRSSFRDWAAERSHVPAVIAEAALGHVIAKGKTEAAYYRTTHDKQRRKLMAAWAGFVTTAPARIVAMHG